MTTNVESHTLYFMSCGACSVVGPDRETVKQAEADADRHDQVRHSRRAMAAARHE